MSTPDYSEKACTKCGTVHPVVDFPNDPKGKLGKSSRCRSCTTAVAVERRRRKRAYFRPAVHGPWEPEGCKYCRSCAELKQLGEFVREGDGTRGRRCKLCQNARVRARRAAAREAERALLHGPWLPEDWKVCVRCRKAQHHDNFYVINPKKRSPRRSSYCIPCNKLQSIEWAKRNPEAVRRHRQGVRGRHGEQMRKRSRERYRTKVGGLTKFPRTPERVAAQRKVNYQRNREYYRQKNARWVQENPLQNRLRKARRDARKRGAEGNFSKAEFLELCEQHGNACLACGADWELLEADHVVPLTQGGTNWISNIQPLCRSCNASKREQHIDYR